MLMQAVSLHLSSGASFAKVEGPREGLEGDWEGEDLKVRMVDVCTCTGTATHLLISPAFPPRFPLKQRPVLESGGWELLLETPCPAKSLRR